MNTKERRRLVNMSRRYAPKQTTYVRLLRPGDRFYMMGDYSRLYTVAEKPIQDEEAHTISVLLVGNPTPYVFEYDDRVRLH